MLSVEQITQAVQEAALSYPIQRVCLFGSYADGTATEESDIDLYVQFQQSPISFFRVMGLRGMLERRLGKDVDIVKSPPQEDADMMVCIYES